MALKLGILGGGQLARMLAQSMPEVEFRVVDSKQGSSSSFITNTFVCDYLDTDKISKHFDKLDVVTYEFENIPQELISELSKSKEIYPPIKALELTKHRVSEKEFLKSLGVKTPDFVSGNSFQEILDKVKGFPVVVKTCSFGYDGKGQWRFYSREELEKFVQASKKQNENLELIAEQFVDFDYEVSCIAARSKKGDIVYYPLCENEHRDGILFRTIAPSIKASDEVEQKAKDYTKKLLEELDYVGILAVEYFVAGNEVIFNEYAPRVHNSGHWSIEGTNCSQFENHLRACLGLELGDASAKGYSLMYNLLGTKGNKAEIDSIPNATYHWYDKGQIVGKRKVGHVTFNFETKAELKDALENDLERKII